MHVVNSKCWTNIEQYTHMYNVEKIFKMAMNIDSERFRCCMPVIIITISKKRPHLQSGFGGVLEEEISSLEVHI